MHEHLPLAVSIECVDIHSTATAPRPQRTSLICELLFWCASAAAAASTQIHLLQHCTAMPRSSSALYTLCATLQIARLLSLRKAQPGLHAVYKCDSLNWLSRYVQ
jgi:hypothetical protein